MRKRDELTNPGSCMSRARDDEMTFVLLGRDAAAPAAIREWCDVRLELGKNRPDDPQIVGALECADTMDAERNGAPPAPLAPPDGVALIAAERRRQVSEEGWTPEHDDWHTAGGFGAGRGHLRHPRAPARLPDELGTRLNCRTTLAVR